MDLTGGQVISGLIILGLGLFIGWLVTKGPAKRAINEMKDKLDELKDELKDDLKNRL